MMLCLVAMLFALHSTAVWSQGGTLTSDPIPSDDSPQSEATTDPIVIRTHNYEIQLTPVGAFPNRWDLFDQAVVGTEANESKTRGLIGLVPTHDDFRGSATPFEIRIPSQGDSQTHSLNATVFQTHHSQKDGWHRISFRSPPLPGGLTITKTYNIPDQGYESDFVISLRNDGHTSITIGNGHKGIGLTLGPGLGTPPQPVPGVGGGLYSFIRPALDTAQGMFDGLLEDEEFEVEVTEDIRWGGIHRRYFLAALSPDLESSPEAAFSSSRSWIVPSPAEQTADPGDDARFFPSLTLFGSPLSIAPNETVELKYSFFFGPKDRKLLRSSPSGLESILFPGLWNWMRQLCFVIMSLLDLLHAIIPSWGLSIIGLAVVIRLLTLPLAHIGLKHQAQVAVRQAEFNRRMAVINEKYKDDPTRRSQESWKTYKEHGVGPVSTAKGCLWLIVQIPIFIALFNLLGQSFALRGARFLWIDDLAAPDRLFHLGVNLPFFGEYFNILPFLMAATQVFVSNISANSQSDPAERAKQRWFMAILAVVFLVLFYSFPAGLVLYWMTSNMGQLLQQWLVGRSAVEPTTEASENTAD